MTQVETIYATLIHDGFGQYSRDITLAMTEMLLKIAEAKDELKPQDSRIILNVKPNTKVTVTIESL